MKQILLLSLILLASCGPSKEEVEAREKFRADSIEKLLLSKEVKPEEPKVEEQPKYYLAAEYGLPAGKVIRYSPSSDFIADHSDGGTVNEQIYVHIQFEDGHVSTYPVEYKTWLVLREPAILK